MHVDLASIPKYRLKKKLFLSKSVQKAMYLLGW